MTLLPDSVPADVRSTNKFFDNQHQVRSNCNLRVRLWLVASTWLFAGALLLVLAATPTKQYKLSPSSVLRSSILALHAGRSSGHACEGYGPAPTIPGHRFRKRQTPSPLPP